MRVLACITALVALLLVSPEVPGHSESPPQPQAEPTSTTAPADPPSTEAGPRLSRLQGTAFAGRRRGISGVTVVAHAQDDRSTLFVTSTNDRGQFRIDDLENGDYSVLLERAGYTTVEKHAVGLRYPFRAIVEVAMVPLAVGDAGPAAPVTAVRAGSARLRLTGTLRGQDGEPLDEVHVRLVRRGGGADPRHLRTADDGSFAVPDLPPGHWRVVVDGVGFLPILAEIDVRADTDLRVWLVDRPPDYKPTPLELMPPERVVAPELPVVAFEPRPVNEGQGETSQESVDADPEAVAAASTATAEAP